MFVRLFYSSISFMQIQIVGVAGLPRYAVVRERKVLFNFGRKQRCQTTRSRTTVPIVW
jgi:hypothetical protein